MQGDCPICIEPSAKQLVVTDCGHNFCLRCFMQHHIKLIINVLC